MNKNTVLEKLEKAKKILQYAVRHCMKDDYPLQHELIQLSNAKSYIDEAELLLKENTGAITEAAHFANTMLGEVPNVADSSETGSVRQNEQRKEVCQHDYIDENGFAVINCLKCGEYLRM